MIRSAEDSAQAGLTEIADFREQLCILIGDNENDAAAAHAAGVPLVLMRYGYARVDPATLAAAALLDRFADLPQTLERLGLTP